MIMFHIFQHKMSKRCNGGGKMKKNRKKWAKIAILGHFWVVFQNLSNLGWPDFFNF